MDALSARKLSFEDYIQLEQETNTKYEYHNGEVFAMAGGSTNHSVISGNVFFEARLALQNKKSGCNPFNSDTKLQIPSRNKYVYPDMIVVCDPKDVGAQAVQNPIIIVEVLSDSTAQYDRGDKFKLYRSISFLQEYILIAQDKPAIDIFSRRGDLWRISSVEGLDQTLTIDALGIKIPMERIYQNVQFEMTD